MRKVLIALASPFLPFAALSGGLGQLLSCHAQRRRPEPGEEDRLPERGTGEGEMM